MFQFNPTLPLQQQLALRLPGAPVGMSNPKQRENKRGPYPYQVLYDVYPAFNPTET